MELGSAACAGSAPTAGPRRSSRPLSGTTATPPTTAPVTSAVAHTLAISAPLPAAPMPTISATRVETGSAESALASRVRSGIGVIAAAVARSELRARFRSWRTAPSVTPSARAISA